MFRKIMSSVREDLRHIFDNSLDSVKPNSLIKNFIEFKQNKLLVKNITKNADKKFSLQNTDIYILGAGKAVLKMCEEFLHQFDVFANSSDTSQMPSIRKGLLSVPIGSNFKSHLFDKYDVKYISGAVHNMPDIDSMRTTQKMVDLINEIKSGSNKTSAERSQLIISFISGGGSALLTLPKPGLTLEHKYSLISRLVKSGATIDQLNIVRQCLSRVKSGKLAKMAITEPNSVPIICFIISDIINDPIDLIASGPTVISQNKPSEKAIQIINKLNVEINNDIKNIIVSEDKEFSDFDFNSNNLLDNIIIGNNMIALNVAQNMAKNLGYKVIFLGNDIKGEARIVAQQWTQMAIDYKPTDEELQTFKGVCWIAGGETTVNMVGSEIGLGGRCQEMCLSFYQTLVNRDLKENYYFLCAGTDGQDGPTDVAGVIAENPSKLNVCDEISSQSEIDLKNHNSNEFFRKYYENWFIKTGVTGTNVMDLYFLVKSF